MKFYQMFDFDPINKERDAFNNIPIIILHYFYHLFSFCNSFSIHTGNDVAIPESYFLGNQRI